MKPLKICKTYIKDSALYLIFDDFKKCSNKNNLSNFVVGHPYNFDFGEWFNDFKCYSNKYEITKLIVKTKANFDFDKAVKLLNNKHGFNIDSYERV